ncbi:MAG TPA: response regulator transcription factor [Solirubrobacterales bacterium]|nr:response regulator transcription factor [Solirubrobacterales bacterium]
MEARQEPIRVLVVDDEDDSRTLLVEMLSETGEVIVAGTASSPGEAIEVAGVVHPDVVLIDWIMPDGGGPKAATDIVAASPSTRVLGVSAGDPTQASHEMMMGGAHGFLPKGSSVEQLVDAIRSVARF